MDRLNLDQNKAQAVHDYCEDLYPQNGDPCPGTALKLWDDVEWLGILRMRVCWGHDHPDYFNAYEPDFTGDGPCNCDAHGINDRAPFDSEETPMPIYPQQAQQAQRSAPFDPKKALQHFMVQLKPEARKRFRELVKQKRPELLRP